MSYRDTKTSPSEAAEKKAALLTGFSCYLAVISGMDIGNIEYNAHDKSFSLTLLIPDDEDLPKSPDETCDLIKQTLEDYEKRYRISLDYRPSLWDDNDEVKKGSIDIDVTALVKESQKLEKITNEQRQTLSRRSFFHEAVGGVGLVGLAALLAGGMRAGWQTYLKYETQRAADATADPSNEDKKAALETYENAKNLEQPDELTSGWKQMTYGAAAIVVNKATNALIPPKKVPKQQLLDIYKKLSTQIAAQSHERF